MRRWIVLLCAFMRLDTILSKSEDSPEVLDLLTRFKLFGPFG